MMTTSNAKLKSELLNPSERTLQLCIDNGLDPDPIVYAVFYSYVENPNSRIGQSVSALLMRSGQVSHYDVVYLFERYFLKHEDDTEKQNLANEITDNVTKATVILEQNAESTKDFAGKLQKYRGALKGAREDSHLQTLVSDIAADADVMRDNALLASQKLESYEEEIQALRRKVQQLTKKSATDPLTGVSNRGAFDDALIDAIDSAELTKNPFCLAIADLDKFKLVNDTFGHVVGDQVLKFFASILQDNTKGADTVARYGGEEFAIILPETDLLAAHNLMVKIKHQLQETRLIVKKSAASLGEVTASFGVVRARPEETADDLVARADAKLYQAKEEGRNRVVSEGL